MKAIDILVDEHRNILRLTEVIRRNCIRIIEGKEVETEEFRKIIDFIRNYADKHHHGKEEKFLFIRMQEFLGTPAEKLVKNGMLVEHDLARLHVAQLEKALDDYDKSPDSAGKLDIISNAQGYADLLRRHIEKEDKVVYTFAERQLSETVMEELWQQTEAFEREASARNVQENYLELLSELEEKVGILA